MKVEILTCPTSSVTSKPQYVNSSQAPQKSKSKKCLTGIPKRLSFDEIVAGNTCPPMTNKDFMKYLLYVEHCSENLQFYLWCKDYEKRFQLLSQNEQSLSPEYIAAPTSSPPEPDMSSDVKPSQRVQQFISKAFSTGGNENDSIDPGTIALNPVGRSDKTYSHFNSPPRTASTYAAWDDNAWQLSKDPILALENLNYQQITAEAFQKINIKWQPFSVQPFREEISRVIAIYIAEGSPRELNISARDRVAILRSLSQTTHPSAFRDVLSHIEGLLRFQSHPNFVRWSIGNANPARRMFSIVSGIIFVAMGFVAALLIMFSGVGRGWRAMGAIGWVAGIPLWYAGKKSVCIILRQTASRQLRPWEIWVDDPESNAAESKSSFDSYYTSKTSLGDDTWMREYDKRPLLTKMFLDKTTKIEESAISDLQRIIFIKSLALSVFASGILSIIFVLIPALPAGKHF